RSAGTVWGPPWSGRERDQDGDLQVCGAPGGRRPREGLTSRFQICAHLPVKTGTYVGGGDTFSLMQRSSPCAPYAVRLAEYQARPSGSTRSNWILEEGCALRPCTACTRVFRAVVQAPRRRTPKRTANARTKLIGFLPPRRPSQTANHEPLARA